jgi:hypothetical protein
MNNTVELKKVDLLLDENQLCTLITLALKGQSTIKEGHTRQDVREVLSILRNALVELN